MPYARHLVLLVTSVVLAAARPAGADAQVFLSQGEALEIAFPAPAEIQRRTAFLTEQQTEAARRLAGAGVDVDGGVITFYEARRGGEPLGYAYFDVHRVRTLPEVLMFVVSPEGRIEKIEVLKFSEPPQYLAPEGWIDQIEGKALSDRLSLKGEVINMTGATLTSRAIVEASRRVLALHRVIHAPHTAPAALR